MSKTNLQRGYDVTLSLGGITLGVARDTSYTLNTSEEADVSVKSDGIWEDWIGTAKNCEASADILVCDEASMQTLLNAWKNDTTLAFIFGDGVEGNAGITNIESPQELRGAVIMTVNFKSRGALTSVTSAA